jgi:hypothetical protein
MTDLKRERRMGDRSIEDRLREPEDREAIRRAIRGCGNATILDIDS